METDLLLNWGAKKVSTQVENDEPASSQVEDTNSMGADFCHFIWEIAAFLESESESEENDSKSQSQAHQDSSTGRSIVTYELFVNFCSSQIILQVHL